MKVTKVTKPRKTIEPVEPLKFTVLPDNILRIAGRDYSYTAEPVKKGRQRGVRLRLTPVPSN